MTESVTLDLSRPYLLYQRPKPGPLPSAAEGAGNDRRYGDFYQRNAEPRSVSSVYHFQDGKSPEVVVVHRDGRPLKATTEAEFLQDYLSQPMKDGVPFFTSLAMLATAYAPSYINWQVSRGP